MREKMVDLIDRQAAIDELKEHRALYCDNTPDTFSKLSYAEKSRVDELDAAISMLVNLPSAQQEPRWIPVEERIPENRDWVLGIFQECDTGWINPIPFVCDYVGSETPITTSDFWILKSVFEPSPYYQGLKCVAWMHLPKPYERSEE